VKEKSNDFSVEEPKAASGVSGNELEPVNCLEADKFCTKWGDMVEEDEDREGLRKEGGVIEWANINLCSGHLYLPVKIGDKQVNALVDSGSAHNILSLDCYHNLGQKLPLRPSQTKLRAAGGTSIQVEGEISMPIVLGKQELQITLMVAKILEKLIIGSSFLSENGGSLSFQDLTLTLNGLELPLVRVRRQKPKVTGRVMLVKGKKVQKRGILKCKIEGEGLEFPGTYWYTPTDVGDKGKLPYLVNLCRDEIEVPVDSEISEVEINFNSGDVLGNIEEIGEEFGKDESEETWNWSKERRTTEIYKQLEIEENQLLTREQKERARSLIDEFHDVFSLSEKELGLTDLYVHEIKLKSEDVIINKIRPIPMHSFDAAKKLILDLLEIGVLEPSNAVHKSSLVVVGKKDGGQRVCADLRELNRLSEDRMHPMPTIWETRNIWAGCRWWSTLDMSSSYHQIPLKISSRDNTIIQQYTVLVLVVIDTHEFQWAGRHLVQLCRG
jgi:hypothetical protein